MGRGRKIVHGMSKPKHPIYNAWVGIKQRCYNPNRSNYKDYGGRGIKVCESWLTSFEAFLEDMGTTWKPKLELDRIDNNGNYEPGNCKWSSHSEQNINRRKYKHTKKRVYKY